MLAVVEYALGFFAVSKIKSIHLRNEFHIIIILLLLFILVLLLKYTRGCKMIELISQATGKLERNIDNSKMINTE